MQATLDKLEFTWWLSQSIRWLVVWRYKLEENLGIKDNIVQNLGIRYHTKDQAQKYFFMAYNIHTSSLHWVLPYVWVCGRGWFWETADGLTQYVPGPELVGMSLWGGVGPLCFGWWIDSCSMITHMQKMRLIWGLGLLGARHSHIGAN